MKNLKIGIIGAGSKRYKKVYRSLLNKIGCSLFCWNRSKNKIKDIKDKEVIIDKIENFYDKDLDIILCFIPDSACYDFIEKLKFKPSQIVLIETPVTDTRWFSFKKFKIGVLEQWPYLPIELFKNKIYDSKVISKPYQIINDGRSFDYHAIAQMRSFCNKSQPETVTGILTNNLSPGYVDFRGKNQSSPDEWCYGLCKLKNNVTLVHMFSYNCKLSILKPYQMMRHCSVDGSITSGRNLEMENDYELYKITYLENSIPKSAKVERLSCQEKISTKKILCKDINVEWKNKFFEFGLTDHETAIAYMIENASKQNLYDPLDSYIDSLTIHGFKTAAVNNQVIKFS